MCWCLICGGGQGGGNPGVMGVGGLREAGEEGAGSGISKRGGAGRNGKNFATLAQYFAIGKVRGGRSRYGRGRDPRVQGAGGGMFRPPCPPPPHTNIWIQIHTNTCTIKHLTSG